MVRFPEADKRLFKNIFVCRRTKRKIRADPLKVNQKKVRGRGKNATRNLRPLRKK